jgi:Pilus assembly protein, PilP
MRLAKATVNLMAVVTMSLCAVPGAWAQSQPAKKPRAARKAAAPVAAKQAAGAPDATPAPDASAGGGKIEAVGKRDPFMPLVTDKKDTGAEHLPPGKAGIVIASVRVDGTVKSGNGMIAVVSNPDERVYFIREGDRLYDGDVEKISLDGVTFKENSKDAFGKPVERIVTKRIYASAGEQQ